MRGREREREGEREGAREREAEDLVWMGAERLEVLVMLSDLGFTDCCPGAHDLLYTGVGWGWQTRLCD